MPSTDEVLVILSSSRPMPYYAPPRRDVIDERVRFVATGDKRPRSIGFRSLVIPLDDKRVLKTSINVPLKEARAMEHVRQVRGFSQHSSDAFTLGFRKELTCLIQLCSNSIQISSRNRGIACRSIAGSACMNTARTPRTGNRTTSLWTFITSCKPRTQYDASHSRRISCVSQSTTKR